MKSIGLPIMFFCLVAGPVAAGDPSGNSDMALEDDFDRDELGEGWKSYCQLSCPENVSGGVFLPSSIDELSTLNDMDDLFVASESSPFL